jgi:hypothetical protein
MEFKFGFIYNDVKYGWYKKDLYKLPYTKDKRSYSFKIIKPIIIGCTTVYNIQRNKLTINNLKKRTLNVKWNISTFEDKLPF